MILRTKYFNEWYEIGPNVFIDDYKLPKHVDHLDDLDICSTYGIYQRYFLECFGWTIYVKPDFDKFSIHIEDGINKKMIYQTILISNNFNIVQEKLVKIAFKLSYGSIIN